MTKICLKIVFTLCLALAAVVPTASATAYNSNVDCLEGTKMFLHVTYKGKTQSFKFCYRLPSERVERKFELEGKQLPLFIQDTNITILDDGNEHRGTPTKVREDPLLSKEYPDYQALIE